MATMQSEAIRLASNATSRLSKWREESKETMEKAMGSLASGATGFGLGYYYGKKPDATKILGLDMEVFVAGVALTSALVPQISRKLGTNGAALAEGIGNGALSIYGYKMGLERGKQAK
jgi:hypothetical protein